MIRIAIRNLLRQKQRYIAIFIVLVFGFGLIMTFMSVATGINQSMHAKAVRYFAGDITISGNSKVEANYIKDEQTVLKAISASGVPIESYCRRSIYEFQDALINFNGESIRLRRMVGLDWQVEKDKFETMELVSGDTSLMPSAAGILLSTQVAEKTGIRVGDECTVVMSTWARSKNTINLVVSGIFQDDSFFGSIAYLDIDVLNVAWGFPKGIATHVGVVLKPGVSQDWAADRIQEQVAKDLLVFPVIHTRQEQAAALNSLWGGQTYAVMTLDAYLSTVNDILEAITWVTWLVLAIFFAIIMVGISNTYRMIVRERIREIGTMRALGMKRSQVVGLFLVESLFLGVAGSLGGLLLSLLILSIIGSLDLSSLSLAAIFLERGRLSWSLTMEVGVLAVAALLITSLFGVFGPARQAGRLHPVQALSQE